MKIFRNKNCSVGKMVLPEFERHVAPLDDKSGVGERVRDVLPEDLPHLLRRSEVIVVSREAVSLPVVDVAVRLNAEKDVVPLRVGSLHVVCVVGRDQGKAVASAHLDQGLVHQGLFGNGE